MPHRQLADPEAGGDCKRRHERLEVSASGLLRESTTEEEQLLDIVMEDYIARQSWPNYQYVEAVLYQRHGLEAQPILAGTPRVQVRGGIGSYGWLRRSEEHTSELQSLRHLVCRL